MKIQIYYNKNYIPFDLYINSIYNIFTPFYISNADSPHNLILHKISSHLELSNSM
jgi:hypothetical protein